MCHDNARIGRWRPLTSTWLDPDVEVPWIHAAKDMKWHMHPAALGTGSSATIALHDAVSSYVLSSTSAECHSSASSELQARSQAGDSGEIVALNTIHFPGRSATEPAREDSCKFCIPPRREADS